MTIKKPITLRDVMFICHPKPKDAQQAKDFKDLAEGTLESADTWEVTLSAKGNTKESWERLLVEKKLGGLALLRNMRNMIGVSVDSALIRSALTDMKTERILPYRFIASAKYAPDYEPDLELAMYKSLVEKKKMKGKTVLLVDVSGSMDDKISEKSDLQRIDAACGLAILARELCEDVEVYSFSNSLVKIPARRGFALRDSIVGSQSHSGTDTGKAVKKINELTTYDRLIIITDEQSMSRIENPKGKGYVINVAHYENGIGYDSGWNHINGWSEAVLDYIKESEEQ